MTKTELKHIAQNEILHFAGSAFYALGDTHEIDSPVYNAKYEALETQYKRLQKLFGLEPTGFQG